tara:strand:+ start:53 stop:244 length:192 start_codon:yes stop_codon:yes gene_type:complete
MSIILIIIKVYIGIGIITCFVFFSKNLIPANDTIMSMLRTVLLWPFYLKILYDLYKDEKKDKE